MPAPICPPPPVSPIALPTSTAVRAATATIFYALSSLLNQNRLQEGARVVTQDFNLLEIQEYHPWQLRNQEEREVEAVLEAAPQSQVHQVLHWLTYHS